MEQRVYRGRLVRDDGAPIAGAMIAVARGSSPTPEVARATTAEGRFAIALPAGTYELRVSTPDGVGHAVNLDTRTLDDVFTIRLGAPGPSIEKGDDMPVSNDTPAAAKKLQSVSNVGSAEAGGAPGGPIAAPARVVASIPGKRKTDAPGISAKDLIVRGTQPLKRRAERGFLESIIGEDERVRILDTDGDPWRMICSLGITSPYGQWIGTGWFAGPRTVITAGHCVYGVEMGGWATEISLLPGRSAARKPFPALTSRRFSTTDRWFQAQEPDFDYAVIHLGDEARAVTDKTGWFETAVVDDAGLVAQRVNVAGYPGDKDGGTTQWHHAKQILRVTEHRVFYDVDTMGGQSGAPVWLDTDDGPRVIGIHAYGTGASLAGITANSAPRISLDVLETIRGWIEG